jgi:hypothetical protein
MKFQILIPWQLYMESDKTLKYTCYLLAEESISKNYLGFLDYLKTNKRVLLPSNIYDY